MELDSCQASVGNIGDLDEDAMKAVYSKYSFKKKEEPINKLAINAYKEKVSKYSDNKPGYFEILIYIY